MSAIATVIGYCLFFTFLFGPGLAIMAACIVHMLRKHNILDKARNVMYTRTVHINDYNQPVFSEQQALAIWRDLRESPIETVPGAQHTRKRS